MNIGSLGDVHFYVNSDQIQTIRDMAESVSSSVSTHARHNSTELAEFTGSKAGQFTFNMLSSKFIGAAPETAKALLYEYCKTGRILLFLLGTERIGSYRWIISKIKTSITRTDRTGKPAEYDFSVTLTEYTKE